MSVRTREAYACVRDGSVRDARRAKTPRRDLRVCKERLFVARVEGFGGASTKSRFVRVAFAATSRDRRADPPTASPDDAGRGRVRRLASRDRGVARASGAFAPRGNRKHGFFSRREESLENARAMKNTGETTELKPNRRFSSRKNRRAKGNERRAPWSGRRGTPPLPSAARSRGASVATPSSRWVSSAETAASCANSGGFWVNIRSVRAVRRHRGRSRHARNRDASEKRATRLPACSVRVGTRSVPPASGDVHVLNQDLSARDIGVGLPGLPSIVPVGVIVHHPHRLSPARAVSLLHRARIFRLLPETRTARCRFP